MQNKNIFLISQKSLQKMVEVWLSHFLVLRQVSWDQDLYKERLWRRWEWSWYWYSTMGFGDFRFTRFETQLLWSLLESNPKLLCRSDTETLTLIPTRWSLFSKTSALPVVWITLIRSSRFAASVRVLLPLRSSWQRRRVTHIIRVVFSISASHFVLF